MKFRYLIFERQEVIEDQESSQANFKKLDFERLVILGDAECHVYLVGGPDSTTFKMTGMIDVI